MRQQSARRAGAAVILITLAILWLVLSGDHSSAAFPVLVVAFAFSVACAALNLKGKL